ncbi:MAG: DUF542 domain-containing protein [Acidobacteriota bacterium]
MIWPRGDGPVATTVGRAPLIVAGPGARDGAPAGSGSFAGSHISASLPTHPAPERPLADRLWRRFFLAGIAVTLTAGASWGAILLLDIAIHHSFTAPTIFAINAHAQAQIYGWVGLFIMGFAYQAFPRFWGTTLARPRVAAAALVPVVGGIALRAVAEPLHDLPAMHTIAVLASALQLAGVLTFAFVIVATARRSERRTEPSDLYIGAAVAWFVVAAMFDLFHLIETMAAPSPQLLVRQIATFQYPLRDLQIHGLAMMMIFGVSLRQFPIWFATPAPRLAAARRLWLPLQAAVVAEVVGFILAMRTRAPGWMALFGLATVALAGLVVLFVHNQRIFASQGVRDRSLKFVRAAQIWLLISLAMLVATPVYLHWTGSAFSHAWYGAMRHAITVGFISLTIMGVAGKVVPMLRGVGAARLPGLWLPFILVNLGCALRVTMQVATDFTRAVFPVAGASGLLEVVGLAVWGAGLARLMFRRASLDSGPEASRAVSSRGSRPTAAIDVAASVAETVRRYPGTLAVFSRHGMDSCCGGAESVANAAAHNGVDLPDLLEELAHHVR